MNLVTRCPACGTAFRVQRDQLAAHFGTVRCGKCGSVFNGVAALVEEKTERLSIDPSPQLGLFDPSRRTPKATPGDDTPVPEFLAERAAAPRTWLWASLSVLALGVLGLQIYAERSALVARVPELRPALEAICRVAACAVPLPRRPDLIRIVSSDMHNDPARQVFVLNALLRNVGRFPQQYPELELTLTEAGEPVTRRILRPAEYLDARAAKNMLDVGAEEALRVHVDARSVRASGYELCVYPDECVKQPKQ